MAHIESEASQRHQNQIQKHLENAAVYILGAGLMFLFIYIVIGILNEP